MENEVLVDGICQATGEPCGWSSCADRNECKAEQLGTMSFSSSKLTQNPHGMTDTEHATRNYELNKAAVEADGAELIIGG